MAIRTVLAIPDPRLRLISTPVERIDDTIRCLVADMFETMYASIGIGLAAIQVGEPKRVIVIDASKDEDAANPIAFINPEIIWTSEEKRLYLEGCLSIPEYYEDVERPSRVRVRFLDKDGVQQEMETDGLLATALQHEINHLNGILFIDHISKLKRDRVVKKFAKTARRDNAMNGRQASSRVF